MQCLEEKIAIPFPQNAFKSENKDQVCYNIWINLLNSIWIILLDFCAHLFTFQRLFLKVTGVEKAVYQTLENINALFENSSDPDMLDEEKWNDFRGLVHRQIEESKCVRKEQT